MCPPGASTLSWLCLPQCLLGTSVPPVSEQGGGCAREMREGMGCAGLELLASLRSGSRPLLTHERALSQKVPRRRGDPFREGAEAGPDMKEKVHQGQRDPGIWKWCCPCGLRGAADTGKVAFGVFADEA